MKPLTRIIYALLICTAFGMAVVNTESWGWICLEVVGFLVVCGLFIHIDTAKEYKDL